MAWSKEDRLTHSCDGPGYTSDITDAEWEILEPVCKTIFRSEGTRTAAETSAAEDCECPDVCHGQWGSMAGSAEGLSSLHDRLLLL